MNTSEFDLASSEPKREDFETFEQYLEAKADFQVTARLKLLKEAAPSRVLERENSQ